MPVFATDLTAAQAAAVLAQIVGEMAKPVLLTVDDDPGVSRAVARHLRRRYGENYREPRCASGSPGCGTSWRKWSVGSPGPAPPLSRTAAMLRLARTREEAGREVDTIQADLADLAQVHRMADEVLDRYPQLHARVNNAGVGFGPPGGAREVSADGIELRFAVNHLAS